MSSKLNPLTRPGPKFGLVPITEERKATFLKVLADTGSIYAAARAATPHSRNRQGGYSTFRHLAARDPEFNAAVAEAKAHALGRLEAEMVRRAVEGTPRPIYQQGQLVGYETQHSDNLLMFALRALAPATYNDKRQVEIKGDLNHRHVGLMITPTDLLVLDGADRVALERILEKIADHRGDRDGQAGLIAGPTEATGQ